MEGHSNLVHHTQSALFLGRLCVQWERYYHCTFVDPGFYEHHSSLQKSRHILISNHQAYTKYFIPILNPLRDAITTFKKTWHSSNTPKSQKSHSS